VKQPLEQLELTQERNKRIWIELLNKRGFEEFKETNIGGKRYLKTNYKVNEPDGTERIETWVINTKDSISPHDIVNFNGFVSNHGFNYGVLLTPNTLTGSAVHVLNNSAPLVRVYDHHDFNVWLKESPDIARKYGIESEDSLTKEAQTFLERLGKCKAGNKDWKEYQDLTQEAFTYLFVPPLEKPKAQSRAEDGLEIRDAVFPNRADNGFWAYVRTEYKGAYIVVEAKNKEDVAKNDVLQLSDYLIEKQLGLFGILIGRKIDRSANKQRRKAYSIDSNRMIVLLDDNDLNELIVKKSRGENPEDVLKDRIDLYRMNYRF